MKPCVITISRQFASMGRTIGLAAASALGIELYDRDIVAAAAKRLGLSKHEISDYDETVGHHDGFFMRHNYLFDFSVYDMHRNVFEVQKNIITDYADSGSCIIVGRCADSILRDRDNVISVFIYAPYKKRLENCIKELAMDEHEAAESIKRVDEARAAYRKRYCPECKTEFDDRHIMLDSSRFGIKGTTEILVDIVKKFRA